MQNEISYFRVYDGKNQVGNARLTNQTVKFTIDEDGKKILEGKDHAYLKEFGRIVRKLCKSVGHTSKFSISRDLDSGIEVQRK